MNTKSIRARLIERFVSAREQIGNDWKAAIAGDDSFFNTRQGSIYMQQASAAATDPTRISEDRLERVVLAMEKLTGVESQPVA